MAEPSNKRYCFALDLIPDPVLMETYEQYHRAVWPEILESIKQSGITNLQIYRVENRLFMIMEVNEAFTFEKKKQMDESNDRVREWERLMWNYQQALPTAQPGEKWMMMKKIFQL